MICNNCGNEIRNDESKFCPNCGNKIYNKKNLPEGEELLNGLYLVENYLTTITNKMQQYYDLEREYRSATYTERESYEENLVIESAKDKSQYTLFIAGIAMTIAVTIMSSIISGKIAGVELPIILIGLFAVGKIKKIKSLLYICGAFIVFSLYLMVSSLYNLAINPQIILSHRIIYITMYIAVVMISIVISIFVTSFLVKKYNNKIDMHNSYRHAYNTELAQKDYEYNQRVKERNVEIDAERSRLSNEISNLTDELQAQTAAWYPEDYYTVECVKYFIQTMRNHEADTIKELVKIYKEDKYREDSLNSLSEISSQIEQSIMNQQRIAKLLVISNVIQTANLITNMISAAELKEIREIIDSPGLQSKRELERDIEDLKKF